MVNKFRFNFGEDFATFQLPSAKQNRTKPLSIKLTEISNKKIWTKMLRLVNCSFKGAIYADAFFPSVLAFSLYYVREISFDRKILSLDHSGECP